MERNKRDARAELVQERLKNDPDFAVEYLNASLEEGQEEFLLALKDVIDSIEGTVSEIAKQADLHRVTLHRILSEKGNPTLSNIGAILRTAGFRFKVDRENHAA